LPSGVRATFLGTAHGVRLSRCLRNPVGDDSAAAGRRMTGDPQELVQIDNRWYVLATSSRADDRTRVLKHGETFGLFDRHGDIQHHGPGEQGLYHQGTRFLSHFELTINERRPLLLNSTVKQDNSLLVVDLTTPELVDGDRVAIRKSTLHI